MNKTALITGASGGIGYELAYIHAKQGGNVVLVARSKDKLEQIKKDLENNYKVSAYIIAKDLSLKDSPKEVYDEVIKNQITVDYLINNAGFGEFGFFNNNDWKKIEGMINLNITALTHLTKLFVNDMVKRNNGKIMNVASTAAFQPGPTMAIYYATKAYVLSFSEAISNELKNTGVTVTALCPGPTSSGFQEASSMQESRLVKGRILATSKEVAQYGYNSMLKSKTVAIYGIINYLLANSVRFFPRSAVLKMVRFIQDKR
jgi:short-subunit dehydrogenase